MNSMAVGVDIAKRVFQVHYVDRGTGEIVNKAIKREKFLEHFANRAACLIGMEACGGAHHWARQLTQMGHEVRLMPAEFVKAFNIRNKNDAADARAIWLAVQQPGKPVAVKTEMQQAMLALHRMREQLVKFRTMQINGLRGLLTEYGEVMSKGRAKLDTEIPAALGRIAERLPAALIDTLREQWNGLAKLDEQIAEIERRMREWKKEDKAVKAISEIPGVGLLTATAAVAMMGDAEGVQFGAGVRGVGRVSAEADRLGRQGEPARDQQEGRHVSAHAPDPRCTKCAHARERARRVGRADEDAATAECGDRRIGQQDGANDLGGARS